MLSFANAFRKNLIAVQKIKEVLTLNKPDYFCLLILDLSKTLKHEFHCNYIKKNYDHKAISLYADAYGLTYEVGTNEIRCTHT